MEAYKEKVVALIGQSKYDEEIDLLTKTKDQDAKQGAFAAISGDVDNRPESLKELSISKNFNIQCGIKGGKLSGGQKQRVAIARTIIR